MPLSSTHYAQIAVGLFRMLRRPTLEQLAMADHALASSLLESNESPMQDLDFSHPISDPFWSREFAIAHGWCLAAQGNLAGARTTLTGAVEQAAQNRDLAGEVAALHTIVRLIGEPESATALSHLAESAPEKFVQHLTAHAQALTSRDPSILMALSREFEIAGALLLAAECAGLAAVIYRGQSDRSSARASLQTSLRLSSSSESPTSREMRRVHEVMRLSDAENEVVRLAASGLGNHSIARQLGVSQRTIENHLQRAYSKLGIRSRKDLAGGLEALRP
jgi:DNA-binding NarL/FixJ family response regulator